MLDGLVNEKSSVGNAARAGMDKFEEAECIQLYSIKVVIIFLS